MLKKVAENASLDIIDNNNNGNTWSNVPKLMIQGDYCNLVKDEEGNYRLYINKNNNHPKFNSIDDSCSTYGTYYLCADEGLYLPTGYELGNTFTKCVSLNKKTVILKLDNEDPENRSLGNLIGTDKVTIYIKNGPGNFEEVSSGKTFNELYNESGSKSETISNENYIFVITYSNLIKYTNEDAANGFTPNTFSAEISITYTTNTTNITDSTDDLTYNKLTGAVSFGISIPSTDNGNIIESEEIFIYDAADPGTFNAKIDEDWDTKQVSGITYISGYTANMLLSDISGTEQYITESDERLKIKVNEKFRDNFGNSKKIVKVSELTLKEGSNATFDNRSKYSYNYSVNLNNELGLFAAADEEAMNELLGITITLYSQNGSSNISHTEKMNAPEDFKWFWTKSLSNNILTDNFTNEFNRILGIFNKDNSTVTEVETEVGTGKWASSQSLNGDTEMSDEENMAYQNALLVQDGKLMHPSRDVTGTYSLDMSGTRYYIKKITNEAGGSSNGFFITANGAVFDDADCYIWLVNADTSKPYKIRLNSRGKETEEGAAVSEKPNSKGMWECLIPSTEAGGCTINANTGFYIVIEMTKRATPITGPLKITFK